MKESVRNKLNSAGFERQSSSNPAEFLRRRWRELLNVHLPVFDPKSFWRYSRLREANDPEQGWKLHVSGTILNAVEILETVAPFLKSRRIFYKAPDSLDELRKLNAGIYYDYAQIGKFITVYPPNDRESARLAARLDELTSRFSAPSVPFEKRFAPGSCVYYRYGAFKVNVLEKPDGDKVLAIRDEKGILIPDQRDIYENPFSATANPFPAEEKSAASGDSILKTRFRIFRALSQRGKGGVYRGVDLSAGQPRWCLLKEGRANGETEWNGRDGFWRVKHEAAVLEILRAAKINVPEIYAAFAAENNFYLACEFIEGENLHVFLKRRRRRLNAATALDLAIQLAEIIKRIHETGWLWRDCKPDNLMITKNGKLRPLDFEGACPIAAPDLTAWTTIKAVARNRAAEITNQTSETVDLYALGATIYLLFEGELPAAGRGKPRLERKSVPPEIVSLIGVLLRPPSAKRLTAATVERKLKKARAKILTAAPR